MYRTHISKISSQESLVKFDCGEPTVNRFLRERAAWADQLGQTSTTVLEAKDKRVIVGFYALSASIVEVQSAYDAQIFRNLLDDSSWLSQAVIPYPAIEITWLGVERSLQNQKNGTKLILDIFEQVLIARFKLNIGIIGIQVAALPGALEFYQQLGFEYLHADYDTVPAILETYPMFVKIEVVIEIMKRLKLA